MITLPRDAYSLTAVVYPVVDSRGGFPKRFDMHVEVRVDDSVIKEAMPGFDGRERIGVEVPTALGLQTFALGYAGECATRRSRRDIHGAIINDVDLTAALKHGVTACLDSNVGGAALQNTGGRHPVIYRDGYRLPQPG